MYNSLGERTSEKTTRVGHPRYSLTPEPIHYPIIDPTNKEPYNPFDVINSYTPMENSDVWRYDSYPGASDCPIPFYDSNEERYQPSTKGVATSAMDGKDTIVIDIPTDDVEPMET